MSLDEDLLYDICLLKANWGLQKPKDIKILKTTQEVDDIVVKIIYLDSGGGELSIPIPNIEYLNLLRQKRIKQIGVD